MSQEQFGSPQEKLGLEGQFGLKEQSARQEESRVAGDDRQRLPEHYIRVGALDARLSAVVSWLSRHGVSLMGSTELSVRGRKSGELRRVPVNPFSFHGTQYLVSARGHSQWVRNMRAAGGGELRLGRSVKTFTATEVPEAERPEILRGYLKKWGWEVGRFFNGVTAKSPDEDLRAAAGDHPVFRITITS
jgi:deazaflavin-dependent oxidoreductase (nitroreductase family)